MLKKKRILMVVCIGLLVILSVTIKIRQGNRSGGGGRNVHDFSAARSYDDHELSSETATPLQTRSGERHVETALDSRRSLNELKIIVKDSIQEQEAQRSRVLADYSDETNNFTLVAVNLPSSAQIKEIRDKISSLTKECERSHSQEFDRYLTKILTEYDPFGTKGKKAFYVTLSKEDKHSHSSAIVFYVDDFDGLREKVDPKSNESYRMEHASWYQNPEGGILERLKHIMR